jgi:hypothetical protein
MSSRHPHLGATAALAALVALAAWSPHVRAAWTCPEQPADLTGNGVTDVSDVQCGILSTLAWLGGEAMPGCLAGGDPAKADIDCDGAVFVSDALLIIGYALGSPLATSLDANGDGCADACEPTGDGNGCCGANGTPGCDDPACQADICDLDPFCCDNTWDALCAQGAAASCTACGAPPPAGPCCAGKPDAGCIDATCEASVCAQDAYCCEVEWDGLCAGLAQAAPPCACQGASL